MTSPSKCAVLGRVEPELVGLSGMALARGATRRFRFAVHAAGYKHYLSLINASTYITN